MLPMVEIVPKAIGQSFFVLEDTEKDEEKVLEFDSYDQAIANACDKTAKDGSRMLVMQCVAITQLATLE